MLSTTRTDLFVEARHINETISFKCRLQLASDDFLGKELESRFRPDDSPWTWASGDYRPEIACATQPTLSTAFTGRWEGRRTGEFKPSFRSLWSFRPRSWTRRSNRYFWGVYYENKNRLRGSWRMPITWVYTRTNEHSPRESTRRLGGCSTRIRHRARSTTKSSQRGSSVRITGLDYSPTFNTANSATSLTPSGTPDCLPLRLCQWRRRSGG